MQSTRSTELSYASGGDFPALARSLFGNVRLDFPDGTAANRLASATLGECRISRLQASAHTVFGERVVTRSDDPDAIKLIVQIDGRSELHQAGRRVQIAAQMAVAYDPTRPYVLANPTPVKLLLLQLPRHGFSRAALARLDRPFVTGAGQSSLQQIVMSLMQMTMSELGGLDAGARAVLGNTLIDLVSKLLGGQPGSETLSLDTLRERAKAYVLANLNRSDLSVAEIARQMGCSSRYVFKAFQAEQTTPSDYLWQSRLEQARERLLQDPGRSISAIAYALGFSSSAHFSRAFRQRYDSSPREYRQAFSASTRQP
jgi:AraC-like DNA-binding protein